MNIEVYDAESLRKCRLSRYMTKREIAKDQVGNGGKCRFIKGFGDFLKHCLLTNKMRKLKEKDHINR